MNSRFQSRVVPARRAMSAACTGVDVDKATRPEYSVFFVTAACMFLFIWGDWNLDAVSVPHTCLRFLAWCAWVAAYLRAPQEAKSWTANSSFRIMAITIALGLMHDYDNKLPNNELFADCIFLMAALSALGLAGTARLPLFGPTLANLLISRSGMVIFATPLRRLRSGVRNTREQAVELRRWPV